MVFRCSQTGGIIDGPENAIWDDGEWISWDWVNSQLYENELRERFPGADTELVRVFEQLVEIASYYKDNFDRPLPVFGELGEIFAELTFGIQRHKPYAQGSDGRLGNDHVEIKTISPDKKVEKVIVKRSGNFNKLVVVKINEEFHFEARMIDRTEMKKGIGKFAHVYWSDMEKKQLEESLGKERGIYIAFPTSRVLKSIYRPKNYKTLVNDQHTKVGITKNSFAQRRKGYVDNFDNKVNFIPLAIVPLDKLDEAENLILGEICKKYTKVGRSREWFSTQNREDIIELILTTLTASGIEHKAID
jgi:hypothetical protein